MWALWPSWQQERDDLTDESIEMMPFPSTASMNVIMAFITIAFMLSLVAALWQHTAAVAVASVIESVAHGTVMTSIGATAMALSWTASVLLFFLAGHIYLSKAARKVLDMLEE